MTSPPLIKLTKIHSVDESCVQVQPGCGVLVQCIEGSVPYQVASNERQLGSSISFVAGMNQAVSWLEQAVKDAHQGDCLQVMLSSNGQTKTVIVLAVNPQKKNIKQDAHFRAEEHRLKGNLLLSDPTSKPKNWRDAIVEYNRALHWQSLNPDANQNIVSLRLNIALGNLKLRNWERAATQCDAVLLRDPQNVKAFYRRARASFERGLFQPAISDLRKASRLAPTDRLVADLLNQAVNKHYADVQQRRQQFAEVYAKLVQGSVFEKQEAAPIIT